jgi:hypothetical protein
MLGELFQPLFGGLIMSDRTITILGCGTAGSWIAQHLSCLGYKDFVLYGDYPMSGSLLAKGPFQAKVSAEKAGSSAAALSAQLKQANPDSSVEVHEHFEVGKNDDRMRGTVVGELRSMANCMSAFDTAQQKGLKWVSLGLPSTSEGVAAIVTHPSQLDVDQHLGKPIQSKQEIMVETAKVAALIADGGTKVAGSA